MFGFPLNRNLTGAAVGAQGRGGWGSQPLDNQPFCCTDPASLVAAEGKFLAGTRGGTEHLPLSCLLRFFRGVVARPSWLWKEGRGSWAVPEGCHPRGKDAELVLPWWSSGLCWDIQRFGRGSLKVAGRELGLLPISSQQREGSNCGV